MSEQEDSRANNINVTGDKEGRFIMNKGWIHWEYVTILNAYVPNNSNLKYRKQKFI